MRLYWCISSSKSIIATLAADAARGIGAHNAQEHGAPGKLVVPKRADHLAVRPETIGRDMQVPCHVRDTHRLGVAQLLVRDVRGESRKAAGVGGQARDCDGRGRPPKHGGQLGHHRTLQRGPGWGTVN